MKRRKFVLASASTVLSGFTAGQTQVPSVGLEFQISNQTIDKDPSSVDSILFHFDRLEITPQYLSDDQLMDLKFQVELEDGKSTEDTANGITVTNGDTLTLDEIQSKYNRISPLTLDVSNNNADYISGKAKIIVDHPDILSQSYTQDFLISKDNLIDNGIYLDDFEDNKLSNRDSYSETLLNPESLKVNNSQFTTPSRPEWTKEVSNGISVSGGDLFLDGSTDYVMHTPLDVGGSSWDTPIEWKVEFTHDGTTNGNDRYAVALTGTSYTASNNGNNDTYFTSNGYAIAANDAGRLGVRFGRNMEGGSTGLKSTLISGDSISSGTTTTVRLTRDSTGTWEMFQDGVSKGTATDTTYTDISNMGISGDSRANVTVPYFLVY